jgi:hypothetical protein
MFSMVVLLLPSLACLEIQGSHTLYLSADGTVVWSVLEQGIRFDGPTLEARHEKEEGFLDRVSGSEHIAARALEVLYPSSLTTRVLREETPQTILTEAHFPGIDRVFQNLFTFYELPSTVELRIEEERAYLEIRFWMNTEESEKDDEKTEYDSFLLALLVECRIVLTEGKFIEARGFEIIEGGRVAKPTKIDTGEAEENNTPIELFLTWTTRDEPDEESEP